MNVWQAIFGFIGNYFWTHYFFNLLGAAYTLPSHKLNGVGTPRGLLLLVRGVQARPELSNMNNNWFSSSIFRVL